MTVEQAIAKLSNEVDEESLEASNILVKAGGQEVLGAMIDLLKHENSENRFIAAKTLAGMSNNDEALAALWEAIEHQDNQDIKGDLVSTLQSYDISHYYVSVFKLYLFGSFKVSRVAENLLDYQEFDISARVIKKAKKHWLHYSNNVKQDEVFDIKKAEVEQRLRELQDYLDAEQPQP
ncbi:HEAT repeat domain-containing protein [Roseivirga misakiensis]|uniref:HEAT repeat domain-containing protein n=1 Tax=Roseivirga misakiensis TaxID=1563681 RepID=A0A1E5SZL8_9BACT|nr:HEAT repeat domain-containing protein [Roseivirga misakiensis]OEK04578.1 hypothetical protein BFP71_14025 [Roseivirga misakiensis]